MNERMKQLIADMETKRAMAKTFMAEGESKDVDKAIALLDEADSLEKEFDAEKRLADLQKEEVSRKTAAQKDEPSDVTKAFLEGVRTRFKDFDGQREGSDADGGYIVPKDVVTQINHFKGTEFSLLPYVDYQRVTTNIGSRTYESKATATSFDELDEAGTITQIENLKFQPLTYRIKNYGGFLPVSNQLQLEGYKTQYLVTVRHLDNRIYRQNKPDKPKDTYEAGCMRLDMALNTSGFFVCRGKAVSSYRMLYAWKDS